MPIFHSKFRYRNKTNKDFGVIVTTFDDASGENDSFLTMESSTTEKPDGTSVFDYGARYSEVLETTVSFIKPSHELFTLQESREIFKWLTGTKQVGWLDLYKADGTTIDYSLLGRFTDIQTQQLDNVSVIGFTATFTSSNPWAYSAVQTIHLELGEKRTMTINNLSDDLDTYIYPNVIFTNTLSSGELHIKNNTLDEELVLKNLAANEIVTIDSNQIIYSDKPNKIFGEDCNYKWLRFATGENQLEISGTGSLTISYRYPIKVGNTLVDREDIVGECD
ncbi:MAG TPA: hypothetical protein DCW90_02075 [Lachnospiraceae bacterium]|nr:hypothetical protein [Lachnospiraceae bacterium]